MHRSRFGTQTLHRARRPSAPTSTIAVAAGAVSRSSTLRYRNQRWARAVGLDGLTDAQWLDAFRPLRAAAGQLRAPLALRYHGHQFQTYNPDLGDGRGFLFAQLARPDDGRLLDLGTKGSGRTPWSRSADGRLTLKGGVREVLATEMLEALGVDTSKIVLADRDRRGARAPRRALADARLGAGAAQPLAHPHRHLPAPRLPQGRGKPRAAARLFAQDLPAGLLAGERAPGRRRSSSRWRGASRGSARDWIAAGFVHGVLNTDNINITGEESFGECVAAGFVRLRVCCRPRCGA